MNIQWNKIELQRSSIELLIIDVNFSEARNFPNLFSRFSRREARGSSIKIIPALRRLTDHQRLPVLFIFKPLRVIARGCSGGWFRPRWPSKRTFKGSWEGCTVPKGEGGVAKNQVSLCDCTKKWWMSSTATLVTCHDLTSGVTVGPRLVIFSIGIKKSRFFSFAKQMQSPSVIFFIYKTC